LLPKSKLGWAAAYLLALDLVFLALESILGWFKTSYGDNLGSWVSFLTFVVSILLIILAFKWIKTHALWRLRNRLIVTYIFIGVIPSVLLVAMSGISIYLFSGQFANFVVTSEFDSQLRSLQAVNAAVANELAQRLARGDKPPQHRWMVCGKPIPRGFSAIYVHGTSRNRSLCAKQKPTNPL